MTQIIVSYFIRGIEHYGEIIRQLKPPQGNKIIPTNAVNFLLRSIRISPLHEKNHLKHWGVFVSLTFVLENIRYIFEKIFGVNP